MIVEQKKVKNVFSLLFTKEQSTINVSPAIMISHGVLMKLIVLELSLRMNGEIVMLHALALLVGGVKTVTLKVSFSKSIFFAHTYSFFETFSVYPGTVCVSIEVKKENVTGTYTDEYYITSRKVDGGSQKPIYKLVGGDEYIYYFPDVYGWRLGDIDGDEFGAFSYESKNLIIDSLFCCMYAYTYSVELFRPPS